MKSSHRFPLRRQIMWGMRFFTLLTSLAVGAALFTLSNQYVRANSLQAAEFNLRLELGVGYNTPVIIKYPFWRMTAKNPNAFYVCINQGQAICPPEIERQSVCIHADIGAIIAQL